MRQLQQRLKRVRMLICDIDGVLTDGRLWVNEAGQWCRFFHTLDGVGIRLLQDAGYEVGVISGGQSADVIKRVEHLKIKHVYLNAEDKVGPFEDVLKKTGLREDEVAYIGDEIYDIPLLERAGVSATVPHAVREVKAAAHFVTKTPGGYGAARELADLIRFHGALAQGLRSNLKSNAKRGKAS